MSQADDFVDEFMTTVMQAKRVEKDDDISYIVYQEGVNIEEENYDA